MPKPVTDAQIRVLLRTLADEMPHDAPAPVAAVRRARGRLARNALAGLLAVAALAYGAISTTSRITTPKPQPPAVSPTAAGGGIWTMDAQGKNLVRLTAGRDDAPAWSPDGEQIAFARAGRDGKSAVWVMNADGSDARKIIDEGSSPAWSADGTRIAFEVLLNDRWTIFSVARDGSDDRLMTEGRFPAFSPDGTRFAYELGDERRLFLGTLGPDGLSRSAGRVDTPGEAGLPLFLGNDRLAFYDIAERVYRVLDIRTGGHTRLHNADGDASPRRRPGLGPNGSIVFTHGSNTVVGAFTATPSEIDLDGTRLTYDPSIHDGFPSWSPKAKRFVLTRTVDPGTAVFVMDADGSNVSRLTEGTRIDGGPVMSPDGTKIAFASTRDGYAAIYVMAADGGDQRAVTLSVNGHVRPIWTPDSLSLYVMNLTDGIAAGIGKTVPSMSTVSTIVEPEPHMSPITLSADGTRLAYSYGTDESTRTLVVATSDGVMERGVVSGGVKAAAWGPAEQIAFTDGTRLFVINADGSGRRALSSYAGENVAGLWWGTGGEILFTSSGDIRAMNPATGAVRTIDLPGTQYNPSWTPDGRILFNGEQ